MAEVELRHLPHVVVSISGAVKKTKRIYGRVYRPKQGNLEIVFGLFSFMLGVQRTFKVVIITNLEQRQKSA